MKKVITYGTYDLFHQGHYNLLKRAKDLGDYLIVGVTTDNFDLERGKMNTCNNVMERIEAVKATGLADQIVIEEYKGQKIDDIIKYGVDIFAIGSDWEGYFDYLKEFCKVVYLPRTEGISSTQLREERPTVNLGVIGTGSIAKRFVPESESVANVKVVASYNPNQEENKAFAQQFGLPKFTSSLDELFAICDSVYVASPYDSHYEYCKKALLAGKNVLCETPFVLRKEEADELYQLAEEKQKVLMVALKTAYCPAFCHLFSLLKSGIIGDIVEINTSSTTILEESASRQHGGSMVEHACFTMLPIIKLFGVDYRNINFYSKIQEGVDLFTKAVFRYDHAVASFQVGTGVKTEGNLVISGTKGYVYVPAPWWRTDYFEIRYEDQNQNKKYFYPYVGEGLRYEIKDFVSSVISKQSGSSKLTKKEILCMVKAQEQYLNGINVIDL